MKKSKRLYSIFTSEQWEWVARKYLEGYTIMSLSRFLGVHRATVCRHLQEMGVMPYALSDLPELDKAEFNALGGK